MTPAANPFPGLRPFRESEAHLFFGRRAHVEEVLAELARSRFVAVMGASASGKSSLVYAGVLPALRSGAAPRAASHWRIAPFRPGASPIHNLAGALAAPDVLGGDGTDPLMAAAPLEATLRRSAFGLVDAVQQSPDLGGGRVLVVVDQFEELFRFHGPAVDPAFDGDAEAFVQLLVEAAREDDAPVDVILTMRSDFLGDCARFRELPEAINEGLYLVPRLTRSQLQEAITAPVAASGATLSPRLVQRVLNDAGSDPDMLPVVQHAMMRTWEIWESRGADAEPIDIEHYEACGGLSEALSRHADEAFFALEGSRQQTIAELTFKRITELGDDHREVRRPTPIAELAAVAGASPAAVEECIGHFEGQGRSFVTVSPEGVVDISHESLIRQWPRLRTWVREEAESREVYRRLADAAGRWGRGEAALLRDPDLQIASQWWKDTEPNQAWADRYDPAFEPASRYLERSRKAARRRRVGVAAGMATLAALAVIAVLLALAADRARNQADQQKREAIARQLSTASAQAGAPARPVSILAAVQAVRTTERDGARLPAAEEALRTAMHGPQGVKLPSGPADRAEAVVTAFNGDGSVLATGGTDGRVRLWDVAAPDQPRLLGADGPAITALAVSTDGRWLAAGDVEGGMTLWDVTSSGQGPWPLAGHQTTVTALAFSPDGKRLASGSLDNTALMWDTESPNAVPRALPGHRGAVNALAFSHDGALIATVGGDGVAYVSEVANPTAGPLELLDDGSGMVAVAFSPDGRRLATGSEDGKARLWDPTQRSEPTRLPHDGRVNAVAFSSDGHWLATGSDDRSAKLWDLQDRDGPLKRPVLLAHDGRVTSVAFDSGHRLATGSDDTTARVYDVDRLLVPPVVLAGHEGPVASVAFGGDDRWLATGSNDGTARLWDLAHPSVEPMELVHTTGGGSPIPLAAVAFSPDHPLLATGADDNSVWLWNLDDRTSVPTKLGDAAVEGFEDAGTTAVAFSPDGRRLASGSSDRVLRVWTTSDLSAAPQRLSPLGAGITSLAFSADGSRMAIGVKDGTAAVVDVTDLSTPVQQLEGHRDDVTSVAYSRDGRWLATGSRDRTVRLWTASDLTADPVVLTTAGPVSSVAFAPDGDRLAVGVDTTVELWDVDGGRSAPTDVLDAVDEVTSVAYSPDGRTLLVGAGNALRLWDLSARDPGRSDPALLHGHDGTVSAVAYSSDGTRFASAGHDGKALVWRSLESLLDAGCRRVGRNLTREEWHQLLPGERYQRTCDQWPYGR